MKLKIHGHKSSTKILAGNKIYFAIALLVTVFVQNTFAQDYTKIQPSSFLNSYYNLKDALVANNPNVAATRAGEFVKAVNAADIIIKGESRNALLSDAGPITQTNDLKVQREQFSTLSFNMFVLAKTVKLSSELVYQQYCPMKKTSWLSNNIAIKNPYFGSAMLTCGSVKETL